MKEIILLAAIGNDSKQVILSQPNGAGDLYHIIIEDYYHGQVTRTMFGWSVFINENSWLSIEDCDVILDSIKKVAQ